MSFYLKKFLFIFLPVVLVISGWGMLSESVLKKRVVSGLQDLGFIEPAVADMSMHGGVATFGPITFDKENLSRIGAIRTRTPFLSALLLRPFREISIDDLALTGDIGNGDGFDVSGWKLAKAPLITHLTQMQPFDARFNSVSLNNGQLDLTTPFSALRLQAKGEIERDAKSGNRKLHAALWSVQHQLQTDTIWEGSFSDDGKWTLDLTINDSRLNFPDLSASRISGWISIKRDRPDPGLPVASGQIDAGKLDIGKLSFSDLTLTLEGPMDESHMLFSASVPAYPGMHLGMDLRETPKGPTINAAIETDKLDDLMKFMRDVRDSRDNKQIDTSMLVPLLLTEGNLTRLEKQLHQVSFDKLTLEIRGPLNDLTGKIIAKRIAKNGTTDRHIISLDPGDVNRR